MHFFDFKCKDGRQEEAPGQTPSKNSTQMKPLSNSHTLSLIKKQQTEASNASLIPNSKPQNLPPFLSQLPPNNQRIAQPRRPTQQIPLTSIRNSVISLKKSIFNRSPMNPSQSINHRPTEAIDTPFKSAITVLFPRPRKPWLYLFLQALPQKADFSQIPFKKNSMELSQG
jgi:hypothetical protein